MIHISENVSKLRWKQLYFPCTVDSLDVLSEGFNEDSSLENGDLKFLAVLLCCFSLWLLFLGIKYIAANGIQ